MDKALERLLNIGLALAIAGAVLLVVAHLVNVFVLDGDSWSLDAEVENNAWAWASSVATFTCAFVAVVLAVIPGTKVGRLWFLAGALAFMSVDDLIMIHESIGTGVRERVFDLPSGWGRVTWPAIFFPFLAAVLVLLWRLGSVAGGRAGLWIKGGLTLLVLAVGLELVSAPFYIEGGSTHSVLGATEAAIEEAAELAGWILIGAGLAVIMLLRVRSASWSSPDGKETRTTEGEDRPLELAPRTEEQGRSLRREGHTGSSSRVATSEGGARGEIGANVTRSDLDPL